MSKHLKDLQYALTLLPSIGQKSAARLSYFLVKNKNIAQQISTSIHKSDLIIKCQRCRNYSDEAICQLCQDPNRNSDQLCIVLYPSEQQMIEKLGIYQGRYLVVHALFSPMDNIDPKDLGLENLENYIQTETKEVIFTLPGSPEGQITSRYLSQKILEISPNIKFSRLAQGIPISSELDLIDPQTMMHALNSREIIN